MVPHEIRSLATHAHSLQRNRVRHNRTSTRFGQKSCDKRVRHNLLAAGRHRMPWLVLTCSIDAPSDVTGRDRAEAVTRGCASARVASGAQRPSELSCRPPGTWYSGPLQSSASNCSVEVIRYRDLTVELAARTVLRGDELVPLTAREWAVLVHLLTHQGIPQSRFRLEESLYG
jgi:hypothetical protein